MSATALRVLLVDDEPLARTQLRGMLAAEPALDVVGECGNGRDAVIAIGALAPDVVLLDIEMPELDGFSVVAALPPDRVPAIIFVTAYDRYALRAFEVHALDYVLKPVDRERLRAAIDRARARLGSATLAEGQAARVRDAAARVARARQDARIAVKVDGKHLVLAVDAIDWVEAVDDYVRIHMGRASHLVRGTLQLFGERLPEQFLRIHRSAIINADRIREVSVTEQGDYRITLLDGTRLPSGRSFRAAVGELLRGLAVEGH